MKNSSAPRPKSFLRWRIWLIYAGLFGLSIPWYWPSNPESTAFGLPLWVTTTLLTSLVISGFTAWLLWTQWPDDPTDSSHD